MFRTKYLGMVAIVSTAFLFSGCIQNQDTFPNRYGYTQTSLSGVHLSLRAYSYPYYFDRPFYFFNGLYYYGGYYRNGLYHYGNRRFRHGHYYRGGYRYYNGRRYRAYNGAYGYYSSKDHYKRARSSFSGRGAYVRGRAYQRERTNRYDRFRNHKNKRHRSSVGIRERGRRSTRLLQGHRVSYEGHRSARSSIGMNRVSRGTMGVRKRSRPVR